MVAAIVVILVIIVVLGLTGLGRSLRIVQQYEQGIIFRFGRVLPGTRGPGLTIIRPVGDRMQKVNMQIVAMAVPAREGITRDNASVRGDAVVYFRVRGPNQATGKVQNYSFPTAHQSPTTLRTILSPPPRATLLGAPGRGGRVRRGGGPGWARPGRRAGGRSG